MIDSIRRLLSEVRRDALDGGLGFGTVNRNMRMRAIVGSINLAPGSFDSRRELAIETNASHVLKRLQKVVKRDWDESRSLDLSDAGLLADLKTRRFESGQARPL